MVVPGPGALNAGAGLGTAYASSSPVLLISGQILRDSLGKREGQLHEIEDQLDVFKPITKWDHRVTRVEEVPEAVHEAMRQLKTGRPRLVELEIPPETLSEIGDADIIEPEEYPKAAGDRSYLQRAARLLVDAKRPAIIAGGGTMIAGASQEVLDVAEFIQAPVMTSQQSKGIIPEDHYLAIGTNYASVGPASKVVPESDVLLAVGTRLLMRDIDNHSLPKIIHIDTDPTEFGKNLPTEIGIEADAKEGLAQLLQHLRSISSPKVSRSVEIAGYKEAFKDEVRSLAPEQVNVVESIRGELDDDAIIVSGVTNIGYWSNVAYPVSRPRSYIASSYFGTLGFAFPTALGAKFAQPDRQVVALCGDGGFMYSPGELSTAIRSNINLIAMVFNNGAFGASQWDQTHRYDRQYIGTDLHNPDFVKLAEAFGAVGMRTEPDGIGTSLKQALAANAPVLLEVVLPKMMPPFQIVP